MSPVVMLCRNARRFALLRLTHSLHTHFSSLIVGSVNSLFSAVNCCELKATVNVTSPRLRLHINALSLAHKVLGGISMVVASSATQKRIALI